MLPVMILDWDHPRACGEYCFDLFGRVSATGSPPRMRGILRMCRKIVNSNGITPAHAGNTLQPATMLSFSGDHPRACGEYRCAVANCCSALGSPPRMRGIHGPESDADGDAGITPAHAGNTRSLLFPVTNCKDHPRACGEYTKKSHDIAVHLARNPNFYLVSKFTRMES